MSWTPRLAQAGPNYLNTWDSVAKTVATYNATATWPAGCASINQVAMLALPTVGSGPAFVQATSNIAVAGARTTWPISFTNPNAAGNCLIIAITFTAGSYTAGPVTIADSRGNAYVAGPSGNPGFQGTFVKTWVAFNCAAGANTVTVTMGGGFPFASISAVVHEYANILNPIDVSGYASGPLFGTGNNVSVSLTTTGTQELLFALAASAGCAGVLLGGGGDPIPRSITPTPRAQSRAPSIDVALVDPATSKTNVQWWRYLNGLAAPNAKSVGKYADAFTAAANTPLAIVHGLGTLDVQVAFWDYESKLVTPSSAPQATDANTILVTFGVAVTGRVVVTG